jgi:Domain of unknown function (DUF5134)
MSVAMSTPAWLYYLFGLLMFAVAAYGLCLLVLSVISSRPAGRDVELSHLFMGVAMAGMFVGSWAFGPDAMWELIFAALLVLFIVRTIQSEQQYGLHVPHALIHAVMNFAMLLMYWYPMSASTSGGMSMSGSSGPALDSGVAFVIAVTILGSGIFTLASPNKGASHFGSHAPAYAVVGRGGTEPEAHPHPHETRDVLVVEGAIARPWLVDLSHVAMCVAMGFMLLLMT